MSTTTIDEFDGLPLWAFEPGETIHSEFQAMERLGTGKRCESWLSYHPLHGRVVVKVCRPHQVDHPRGRRAMYREADALVHLHHPAIRSLVADLVSDPFPMLVLAHAPGASLSDILDDEILSLPEALGMAATLVSAVRTIHDSGLVHLDLKPTNVIIGDDAVHPLIIDLGSCRPVGYEPGDGTPLGSPGYAPPELERNETVTPAVDVFGLGTVLYEAVTGALVFDPDLDAVDRPPPPRPSLEARWCPAELDELILAMLAEDPRQRPSMAELDDLLPTLCRVAVS